MIQVAAGVAGGAILSIILQRVMRYFEAVAGAKVISDEFLKIYNRVDIDYIIDQIVADPKERERLKTLLNDPRTVGRLRKFVEFLKKWNYDIAVKISAAATASPTWGQIASNLYNSLNWSLGLGWLSWMGMSPLLNVILTEPSEGVLRLYFPTKTLSRSDIEKALQYNLIDDWQFIDQLQKLGYSEELAKFILQLVKKTKLEKQKDLTTTQILKAMREGVISEDKARAWLKELGYDDEEIDVLINLNKINKEAEKGTRKKDLSASQILLAYRYRVINDRNVAKYMLQKIGYDEDEAELLIKLEDARRVTQRHERTRDLTKTDILKAMVRGILTPEEAKKLLMEVGYDEDEADILIATKLMEVMEREQKGQG